MTTMATPADAELILHLFELRREEKMRKARDWFFGNFKGVNSMETFQQVAPFGSEPNAYYRMITSYWDMAASFANCGALNKELFFKSANEMLFVYIRASTAIQLMRTARANPMLFHELETAATEMIAWMEGRAPGSVEGFRKMVLG